MQWEVCHEQARVLAWLAERLPQVLARGLTIEGLARMRGLGYTVGGELVAVIAFADHLPAYRSVHVHWALDLPKGSNGAFLRGIIQHAARYPFIQLNCRLVLALIPRRAKKARQVARICGFSEGGKIPQAFVSDDAVIYTILRHQAPKWLYDQSALDAAAAAA